MDPSTVGPIKIATIRTLFSFTYVYCTAYVTQEHGLRAAAREKIYNDDSATEISRLWDLPFTFPFPDNECVLRHFLLTFAVPISASI